MVVQQAYHADQSMTIGNVEAVPLYLHCLRQAAPDLQLRGLQVWKKLLQGNMANLSAADRSALPYLLKGLEGLQVGVTWAAKK